jgi:hypothetical protein
MRIVHLQAMRQIERQQVDRHAKRVIRAGDSYQFVFQLGPGSGTRRSCAISDELDAAHGNAGEQELTLRV